MKSYPSQPSSTPFTIIESAFQQMKIYSIWTVCECTYMCGVVTCNNKELFEPHHKPQIVTVSLLFRGCID